MIGSGIGKRPTKNCGQITLYTGPPATQGRGTASEAEVYDSSGPNQEKMTNSQAKPKVLVADDERVIADTLAIILNQSGFEATAVYNGEKAVEAARTLRPDMLISDVIMTDMNGIDAAITIRGMLPNCKILLFSGQAATADLLDRARIQGHEFEILAKPVHPQDLLARLRS
jgi:CheY-like chemotaxis protein